MSGFSDGLYRQRRPFADNPSQPELVQIRHSPEVGLGVVGQFHQLERLAYPRSVDARLFLKTPLRISHASLNQTLQPFRNLDRIEPQEIISQGVVGNLEMQ